MVRVQRVVVFAVESGSKAVWNFSENSSVLDVLGFTYIYKFKSHYQSGCILEHELTQEEWESVCLNTGLPSARLPGLQ